MNSGPNTFGKYSRTCSANMAEPVRPYWFGSVEHSSAKKKFGSVRQKQGSVDHYSVFIEGLDNGGCRTMIENINEKKHFNRQTYCRGLRSLDTPRNKNQDQAPEEVLNKNTEKITKLVNNPNLTVTAVIPIPGLPANKLNVDNKQKTSKIRPKETRKAKDLKQSDFLKA